MTSNTAERPQTSRRRQKLKERERRDYDAVAEYYDGYTTPLTDVFGLQAVELLALGQGQRVLEVACGSGTLLPELARRVGARGAVTGLDQSGAMIDLARRRIEREGLDRVRLIRCDAEELADVEPASHDRALSVFGLMYLPDPLAALRRIRAALRPGGRVVICVWGEPARVPGLAVPMEAGGRVLAPPPLNWLVATRLGRALLYRQLLRTKPGGGKSPMSLSPPGWLDGLLARAGFVDVVRHEPSHTFTYPDFDAYWQVLLGTPARLLLQRQSAARQARAKAITASLMQARHAGPDGSLAIPMGAVIVSGDVP